MRGTASAPAVSPVYLDFSRRTAPRRVEAIRRSTGTCSRCMRRSAAEDPSGSMRIYPGRALHHCGLWVDYTRVHLPGLFVLGEATSPTTERSAGASALMQGLAEDSSSCPTRSEHTFAGRGLHASRLVD